MDERSIRHVVLGVIGLMGLAGIVLAGREMTTPETFVSVTGIAMAGAYLAATVVLGWYAVRRGSDRHLILAITFAFTALTVAIDTAAPGSVAAPWMWAAWHLVLPGGIVVALIGSPPILRNVFVIPANRVRGVAIALGYVVGVTAILYLAPTQGDLPKLGDPTTLTALGLPIVALSGTAIFISLRRGRREDLESWLIVVAAATLVDATVTVGAGHPGTTGALIGRGISLVGAIAMLRAVMMDAGRLWNKLGIAGRFASLDENVAVLSEPEILAQARLMVATTGGGTGLSIVHLAIDGLEQIYDDFGHLTGDRVLQEVGRRLRATLRDADMIGQRSDDSFLLLLPETDTEGAQIAVDRALGVISIKPISSVRESVTVTASAGVAEAQADDSVERVLATAAAALDSARNAGGNRAVMLRKPVDSTAPPGTDESGPVVVELPVAA